LVLENVRRLVEAKRRSGRQTPVLTWRLLAFRHNVHEIPAAMEMAEKIGVDAFSAAPAWGIEWDDPEILPAEDLEPINVELKLDVYTVIAANWNPFPDSLAAPAIEREFAALSNVPIQDRSTGDGPPRPTCEWLYKNITMDAGGRIFPCCCSPRPGAELTFGVLQPGAETEIFHTGMFDQARRFMADPEAYQRESPADRIDPYCVKCTWSREAAPNQVQMRNYFAPLGPGAFDESTLDLLSKW
jgi:hypothetical protein